jgi:type IV pilus assembly protein PilQ
VSLPVAVDAIVRAGGLTSFRREGILYVLRATDEAATRVEARSFSLQFADLVQTRELVTGLLSPSGKLSSYAYGRTLVVWDEPQRLEQIAVLVQAADQRPRQVMIEARILEVTLTDDMALGVNWTEVLNEGKLSTRLTQDGFANNASGARPGFFATLRRGDLRALFEALETKTRVRALANPKVLGLDNRTAEIIIGGRLGYFVTTSTSSATLQSVQFIEVGTQLKLTPHIADDGSVLMDVHPEVSDGEVVNGLPRENTTEATTTVLVPAGETLFLGGLIRDKVTRTRSGVPILGRIPVLGWLFGRTSDVHEKSEIVVLVTPVVADAGAVPPETPGP